MKRRGEEAARLLVVCLLVLGAGACRKGAGGGTSEATSAPTGAGGTEVAAAPAASGEATGAGSADAPSTTAATATGPEMPTWPTGEPCRLAARKVWHAEAKRMELPPTAPAPVDGLPTVLDLAIDEGWNTCAVTPERGVACWGVGIRGLVAEDPDVRGRPGPIAGLADVAAIRPAQTPHACALGVDGSVVCFGAANNRKLGSAANETTWTETPEPVAGLPRATALAVGFGFTCALVEDRTVHCWGRNESGQLGDGTREPRTAPALVPGLSDVTAISAGREQACAVLADRTVRCWGEMLATRCPDPFVAPVAVPGLADVVQLAVGWDHACAVVADGTVRCWGEGEGGQLGDGALARRFTPIAVPGLADVAAVEAGDGVTCALRKDGTVACWGKNHCGQADGGTSDRVYLDVPAAIPGVAEVAQLAVGGMQTCVRRTDGGVLCWGATTPSQLGACLAAWQ
ncbi:MAG: hypothetical protein JXB32_03310 [Deltaproteobacteria bacterium]|nr:hypothetical protein [Deltaproteobacteria bacterium]